KSQTLIVSSVAFKVGIKYRGFFRKIKDRVESSLNFKFFTIPQTDISCFCILLPHLQMHEHFQPECRAKYRDQDLLYIGLSQIHLSFGEPYVLSPPGGNIILKDQNFPEG